MKVPPLVSVETDDGSVRFLNKPPSDADFVVCMKASKPLMLPDNALGSCVGCGCAIQMRPENVLLVIPKLCVDCAVQFAAGQENPS